MSAVTGASTKNTSSSVSKSASFESRADEAKKASGAEDKKAEAKKQKAEEREAKDQAKLDKMAAHVGKDAAHVLRRISQTTTDLKPKRIEKTFAKFLAYVSKLPEDLQKNEAMRQMVAVVKATMEGLSGKSKLDEAMKPKLAETLTSIATGLGAELPANAAKPAANDSSATGSQTPAAGTTTPASNTTTSASDQQASSSTDTSSAADGSATNPAPTGETAQPTGSANAPAAGTQTTTSEAGAAAIQLVSTTLNAMAATDLAQRPPRSDLAQVLTILDGALKQGGLETVPGIVTLLNTYMPQALKAAGTGALTDKIDPSSGEGQTIRLALMQALNAINGKPVDETAAGGAPAAASTTQTATSTTQPATSTTQTAASTSAAAPASTDATTAANDAKALVNDMKAVLAEPSSDKQAPASAYVNGLNMLLGLLQKAGPTAPNANLLTSAYIPNAIKVLGTSTTPVAMASDQGQVVLYALNQAANALAGQPVQPVAR